MASEETNLDCESNYESNPFMSPQRPRRGILVARVAAVSATFVMLAVMIVLGRSAGAGLAGWPAADAIRLFRTHITNVVHNINSTMHFGDRTKAQRRVLFNTKMPEGPVQAATFHGGVMLGIVMNGDSREVRAVIPNSPAEAAGVTRGCHLVSINEQPYQESLLNEATSGTDDFTIVFTGSGLYRHVHGCCSTDGDHESDAGQHREHGVHDKDECQRVCTLDSGCYAFEFGPWCNTFFSDRIQTATQQCHYFDCYIKN
jgi:hypothetical protein